MIELEIPLDENGECFIVGADVEIDIEYDTNGSIKNIVPTVNNVYVDTGRGPKLATEPGWNVQGLCEDVIKSVDWESLAEPRFYEYIERKRQEYIERMYA